MRCPRCGSTAIEQPWKMSVVGDRLVPKAPIIDDDVFDCVECGLEFAGDLLSLQAEEARTPAEMFRHDTPVGQLRETIRHLLSSPAFKQLELLVTAPDIDHGVGWDGGASTWDGGDGATLWDRYPPDEDEDDEFNLPYPRL